MFDSNVFQMRPAEVAAATAQLEALADRVETLMRREAPNLVVTASGRDEVSQRVASTLNEVYGEFTSSTDKGTAEIRRTAATLRAHAGGVIAADDINA